MRTTACSLAGIAGTAGIAAIAFAATVGIAGAQDRCSRETFTVDGAPVIVTLCVAPGAQTPVPVAASFSRGTASFNHTVPVTIVSGAAVSRAVDDVALDALGVNKRLHLTIAYRNGEAAVEHAMLVPGAVVLK
jgi:hypothetical protein